jgi:hypothetical protein
LIEEFPMLASKPRTQNRMFDFDPAAYSAQYGSQGFVHIPKGVTEDFHAKLLRQLEASFESSRLTEFAIGEKQQALYEFPDDSDYVSELFDAVSRVCGLDRHTMVLSERHIKAYEPDAVADPAPHKDRFASQVAVGLSVAIPRGSKLILYPYDHVQANPFNSSAELRRSLSPDRLPEAVLNGARRVEIEDSPRDVVMFRGSAMWHYRSKRPNATLLYLKLNAYNCDPLGEDPRAAERTHQTATMLERSDAELQLAVPLIGRRVDYVNRRYSREWSEAIAVVLGGEKSFLVDEQELLALQAMDGYRTVTDVIAAMGSSLETGLKKIRRLAAAGVVDLEPVAR